MLLTKSKDMVIMFFKSLKFKNFLSLWSAYIKQNSPRANQFTTRDGYRILLSNNPHDAITVMVIFCRSEYGDVTPGSTVFDIGANIGVFSLYAARCGAAKVYAFEPNKESYEVLLNNIKINHLENIIVPINLAVGAQDGEIISIPKSSSPYNKALVGQMAVADYEKVETISLPTFIAKNQIKRIEFLKMDCEGAEYPIIYSMKESDYQLISKFRLEHHFPDEKEKLTRFLVSLGFKKTNDNGISIMWFDR